MMVTTPSPVSYSRLSVSIRCLSSQSVKIEKTYLAPECKLEKLALATHHIPVCWKRPLSNSNLEIRVFFIEEQLCTSRKHVGMSLWFRLDFDLRDP